MTSSHVYSSLRAAQDVARGACMVAWPADEPYFEPTLVAHRQQQSRRYATANPIIGASAAVQNSTSCPSFASCTSIGHDAGSERSVSLSTNSSPSSCRDEL
ncbi:hypothetical protein PWT90_03173 [Aphanocladium album]|nr:hypothetical protein PWT90_03173 [Aphanocladium album]